MRPFSQFQTASPVRSGPINYIVHKFTGEDMNEEYSCIKSSLQVTHIRILFWRMWVTAIQDKLFWYQGIFGHKERWSEQHLHVQLASSTAKMSKRTGRSSMRNFISSNLYNAHCNAIQRTFKSVTWIISWLTWSTSMMHDTCPCNWYNKRFM